MSGVWAKDGAKKSSNIFEVTDVFRKRQLEDADHDWKEFWSGWVAFEDDESYLRYEWMHNFMSTIIEEHKKRGYIFAFSLQSMKRKMMLWLFELHNAAKEYRQPIIPQLHAKHRNNIDDFTEYDYLFNFSNFWTGFVARWATVDILNNYDDKLAALLPYFLYAHLDTARSTTIIMADELKAQIEKAIQDEDDENNGRRPEYQDSSYYKGNKEYL